MSARLSPTAVHHLLTETRVRTIITTPRLANTVKNALPQTASVEVSPTAPIVYLQEPYEHDLRIDPSRNPSDGSICGPNHFINETDRNVLILHSSGTTGLPKPIYQSHRYLLGYTVCHQRSDHEDIGGLNLSTLPLYHVGWIFVHLTRIALTTCYQGLWIARFGPLTRSWQAVLAGIGTCRSYRDIHCGCTKIERREIPHDRSTHP